MISMIMQIVDPAIAKHNNAATTLGAFVDVRRRGTTVELECQKGGLKLWVKLENDFYAGTGYTGTTMTLGYETRNPLARIKEEVKVQSWTWAANQIIKHLEL